MDGDHDSKMSAQDKELPVSRRSFGKACFGAALASFSSWPAWAAGQYGGAEGGRMRHKKISKAMAHYQDHPHEKQHCGVCENFHAPHSCEVVEGRVMSNGWCRYFEARHGGSGSSGY